MPYAGSQQFGSHDLGGSSGTPLRQPSLMSPLSMSPGSCHRTPSSRTVIIWDWDDTLLCSSALRLSQPSSELLQQLERTVEDILCTSMSLGQTLIVTNGTELWIQESAARFLPGLLPVINNLTTISARTKYERAYPEDPFAWKRETFRDLLNEWAPSGGYSSPVGDSTPTAEMNVVAIGDSWYEIEAARSIFGSNYHCRNSLKTVKFREVPSLQELLGQLRRCTQELSHVVSMDGCTSLGLASKPLPQHLECLSACASAWELVAEHGGASDWLHQAGSHAWGVSPLAAPLSATPPSMAPRTPPPLTPPPLSSPPYLSTMPQGPAPYYPRPHFGSSAKPAHPGAADTYMLPAPPPVPSLSHHPTNRRLFAEEDDLAGPPPQLGWPASQDAGVPAPYLPRADPRDPRPAYGWVC